MLCACVVCKIYGYYNKGVYVQLIRSTTKAATRSCMKSIYPKLKLHKKTRNHRYLIKRTSQLHERPRKNSKKRSHCHLFCIRM